MGEYFSGFRDWDTGRRNYPCSVHIDTTNHNFEYNHDVELSMLDLTFEQNWNGLILLLPKFKKFDLRAKGGRLADSAVEYIRFSNVTIKITSSLFVDILTLLSSHIHKHEMDDLFIEELEIKDDTIIVHSGS